MSDWPSPIVGIDLGTTYSLVAVLRDGVPTPLPNALGEVLTPSAVSLGEDGRLLVGAPARARATTHPERTALTFKRDMGTDRVYRLGDLALTPQDLSALVLGTLKRDAEEALGVPIEEAVVTVPAYFDDAQRQATRAAGEIWPGAQPQPEPSSRLGIFGNFAWILIVVIANIVARCPGSPDRPSSSDLQVVRVQQLRDQAAHAWTVLEGSCDGIDRPLPRSSCEAMRRTVLAMENGDCTGARQALDGVSGSIRGASVADVTRVSEFQGRVLMAITSACGSYTLGP